MRILLCLAFFILLNLNAEESKLDLKVFGTLGAVYNDNSDYIFRKNIYTVSVLKSEKYILIRLTKKI